MKELNIAILLFVDNNVLEFRILPHGPQFIAFCRSLGIVLGDELGHSSAEAITTPRSLFVDDEYGGNLDV